VLDTSGRRTDATVCGSSDEWPTPRASERENRTGKHSPSDAANGGRHGNKLSAVAKNAEWPTATAADAKASGAAGYSTASGRHAGTTLTDATTRWPTATTRDWKDGACAEANVPTNGLLGRAVPRTTGSSRARLNPRWVAQLMGYPHDWLAPDGETS